MIVRLPVAAILLLCYYTATSQPASFHILMADDSIFKKELLAASMQQKEQVLNNIPAQERKAYRPVYDYQFDRIREFWESTRPITAPEARTYLQKIVTDIAGANPELKSIRPRVVFSRDWWPNAMSMGDGSIAINAALVTQLDNEAELAFIISHELAHYYLDHTGKSIRKQVATQNSEEFRKEISRLNKQEYRVNEQYAALMRDVNVDSRRHSRSNETEADRFAFRFLKNSGYDCNAVITCLQKLDQVDDSLFTAPLNLQQIFNFTSYPFNNRWIRDESVIFGAMQSTADISAEHDSLKTHPSCLLRMDMLRDSVAQVAGSGSRFQADSVFFRKLQQDLLYEIMEECYRSGSLSKNLYFAITLQHHYPNDQLAIYNIARALNTMYVMTRTQGITSATDKENRMYPREYNLLLRMLQRIRPAELSQLAWHYAKQNETIMHDFPGYKELVETALINKQ